MDWTDRPQIEEDPKVLEDEALHGKQTYTAPANNRTALGASVGTTPLETL